MASWAELTPRQKTPNHARNFITQPQMRQHPKCRPNAPRTPLTAVPFRFAASRAAQLQRRHQRVVPHLHAEDVGVPADAQGAPATRKVRPAAFVALDVQNSTPH